MLPSNSMQPHVFFPFFGDILSSLVISQGTHLPLQKILCIGFEGKECLEGFTLSLQQHHITVLGAVIKKGDPIPEALNSLSRKRAMNIREDEIKGFGVSSLCLVREGTSVLLAKNAGFTEIRHGSVRSKLQVDCQLVLQELFQSVFGDVSQPPVQKRPIYQFLGYCSMLLHLHLSIQWGYVAITHFGIEVGDRVFGERNQVLINDYCSPSVLSEMKGRE